MLSGVPNLGHASPPNHGKNPTRPRYVRPGFCQGWRVPLRSSWRMKILSIVGAAVQTVRIPPLPKMNCSPGMSSSGTRSMGNVYDFGGAGKPDEPYGVRDFKAKFGGKLINYSRNTSSHSPRWLAVSKVGYQIYRKLWSFQQ